ncbi:tyrosine-type recombinase/integrase [Pseudomonas sp. NMI795_08]|uniref:tyrosine-type recombinase/integrase n=1 Tax=Pseudomonas sp. NMI795_08 TaxID=2903144 RepID=UPI001E62D9A5|nr:site-specific integrase [Pseudomonas sp. NMI795_08]MCE1118594.1 site-specific integrase [Pseudomonas sp. NMI795_08]
MKAAPFELIPLFSTHRWFIESSDEADDEVARVVLQYLGEFPAEADAQGGYGAVRGFLQSYTSNDATFNSYRTHAERLLLWSLLIRKRPLLELRRSDAEAFLEFCMSPPERWVGQVVRNRYLRGHAVGGGCLVPNPAWRPFAMTTKVGYYKLTEGSIAQVFSVCSSLFEYAIDEGICAVVNPFRAIKQKSKFKGRSGQVKTTRALTPLQWEYVLEAAEVMADSDPVRHERSLFIAATLFSMYLRVSDICGRDNWQPTMGDFRLDHDGNWWFHAIGKGNKVGKIAVRTDYVDCYLKRYRQFLGLSPLPLPNETTPLLMTLDGKTGLSTRMVRIIMRSIFDSAIDRMVTEGRHEGEIRNLRVASTHWLRHTAATFDAPFRDPKDLQADLRHSSLSTTQNVYYSSQDDQRAYSIKKLTMKDRG